MKAVFLRALEADDKAGALLTAIRAPAAAAGKTRFDVDIESFAGIPRSPFAYWISAQVRDLFSSLPSFEMDGRSVKQGLATTDDFRFVRGWWEVPHETLGKRWVPFAKGGAFSPFYADIGLCMDWLSNGAQSWAIYEARRDVVGGIMKNPDFYFRPGLTYPLRMHRLSVMPLPTGTIISVRGSGIFGDRKDLLRIAGLFSSSTFDFFVKCMLGRFGHPQFDNGTLCMAPVPNGFPDCASLLEQPTLRAICLKRDLDTTNEMSHAFRSPAALQIDGNALSTRHRAWGNHVRVVEAELRLIQNEIDSRCFDLYGLSDIDRKAITDGYGNNEASVPSDDIGSDPDESVDVEINTDETSFVTASISWTLGVIFGRFDVELGTRARIHSFGLDPFDPLPLCPPAMLTGGDGRPLDSAPTHYAIKFPPNGIIVDDPGHPSDLVTAMRSVFDVILGSGGDALWNEAAEILNHRSRNIREWLASSFFEKHLKQYSRGGRKAPIYWQLGTPSGCYSIWLYAHRLTRASFFELQNDVVAPKLAHEMRELHNLRAEAGSHASAAKRHEVEALERVVDELQAMFDEVRRVAPLWNPSLDDGVVLTMAPLWRLVPQHRAWQRELKTRWDELAAGTHEWAHIAMHLWPERVVPKCTTDRSLAIAHSLEDAFWLQDLGRRWRKRVSVEATTRYLEEALQSQRLHETTDEIRDFAREQIGCETAVGWWDDLKAGRHDNTRLALALWPERVLRKAQSQPSMFGCLGLRVPVNGVDDRAFQSLLKRHRPRHSEGELAALDAFYNHPGDAAAWEARWADFDTGRLDDQPLARFLFAPRVIAKALDDHGFAAGHDLARWFWLDTQNGPRRLNAPDEEIAIAVAEREKPAVKAALKAFLDAPSATSPTRRERRKRSA